MNKLGDDDSFSIRDILVSDVRCTTSTLKELLGMSAQFVDQNGLSSLHLEGFPGNVDLNLNDNGEMLHLEVIEDDPML